MRSSQGRDDGKKLSLMKFPNPLLLIIELKWNDSAEGAIAQILNKKYPESLKDYGREILLVGISYDKDAPGGDKKHTCRIIHLFAKGFFNE